MVASNMKTNKCLFYKGLILLLLIFLSSCENMPSAPEKNLVITPSELTETKNADEICMEVLFVDAIPLQEDSFKITNVLVNDEIILSPAGWNLEEQLPFLDADSINIIYTKNLNGIEEFWFEVQHQGKTEFWVLDKPTMEWENIFETEGWFDHFIDNRSHLWLIRPNGTDRDFFVFNEESREMALVMNVNFRKNKLAISDIAYSNDNSLWMITENLESNKFGLTRLDLESGELLPFLHETDLLRGIGIDGQDRIFTFDSDGQVNVYDAQSGNLVSHLVLPTDYPGLSEGSISFYFDEENRVWLNDIAWFNNDDSLSNLHLVFRSPIFVRRSANGYQAFGWERPEPQAETEDGRIWYKSMRGLAWHQPETGEWCMFTSAKSNIVKDSEGNLWIIYDNALYMLPASETSKKE